MGGEEKYEKEKETRKRKENITMDKGEKGGAWAGAILRDVGNIFGFGGILKNMEKLPGFPGFKERLKDIDVEIEQRLREFPLKTTEGGMGRASSMPPGIKGMPLRGKRPVPCEIAADVFDENDHLLITADLPGVEEDTIDISLEEDVLTLSFKKEGRVLKKGLKLPCAPGGEPVKTYKNGILEVKIKKFKT